MKINRSELITEQQNPRSTEIDKKSISEILEIINEEDSTVSDAVKKVIPAITQVVELVVTALKDGQKIIYVGAGTSGRLGILDASEIPPTFSAPRRWFTGVIAGGREAVFRSIERAEDLPDNSHGDLNKLELNSGDVLIGIASSGTTPYVIEALNFGKQNDCRTVFLICNPTSLNSFDYDIVLPVAVGPEIIAGSTRMKAGTATKMILNMLSTASMIKMGKVYGNLMVDLQVVNEKLRDRGTRIIEKLTNLNYEDAGKMLRRSGGSVKTALVMINNNCSKSDAKELLNAQEGNLREIIGDLAV